MLIPNRNGGGVKIIRPVFISVLILFIAVSQPHAAELEKFTNVRLTDNPANDGDSFLVDAGGKRIHLRLYFVDCPETSMSFKSGVRRVREQTRYFGLSEAGRTIHFGTEAKIFVKNILAQPFTVHTAFANALGRSRKGRVYGFITTAEGDDLAALLVKNGFARTHGIGRETPNGILRNEMVERLRDFEDSAKLKRLGIWSESDPDRIAEYRAKQRKDEAELQAFQRQVETQLTSHPLNLNTATTEELQSIKGIGPVLAARIIAKRPYKTVDDLLGVKGIGSKKFEKFRSYFVAGKQLRE